MSVVVVCWQVVCGTWSGWFRVSVGFDHINRNTPVLIRTPKLTRFEPAQYWGGGPPGNSVVLNPFCFFFGAASFFCPSLLSPAFRLGPTLHAASLSFACGPVPGAGSRFHKNNSCFPPTFLLSLVCCFVVLCVSSLSSLFSFF